MSYAIYLSSELTRHDSSNAYGYWDGKTYTRNGMSRCAYVMTYYIEDY